MTTFLTTILVALMVALTVALLWCICLKLARLTVELAVECIVNLSHAYFANRQMGQDLDHNRLKNKLELGQAEAACNLNRLQIEGSLDIAKMEKRIELRRQARAARAQLWKNSDIEIEVTK